ncbi:MAG: hypothetical protein ABIV28_08390 [Longimicrobiales bacterium]
MKRSWMLALGLGLVIAACGKDAVAPGDDHDGNGIPTPTQLATIGSGIITNRYTAEVAVAGTTAYTSTWGNRPLPGNTVYVWNVAGTTPALADSLFVPNAGTLGDVQISPDGKYLVVATEYSPNGSISVYSLNDPRHPVFVSRFQSAHTTAGVHTMKMSVIAGKLYGFLQIDPAGGALARLTIVEMTDPLQITEIYSQTMGSPYIHDVFVRDGFLFAALWNDGMGIYDIGGAGNGNPADPILLGGVDIPAGKIHNIWWFHDPKTGSKKYALLGEEGPTSIGSSSSGDIHVVDVTSFANPVEVATYHLAGAGTHNFWVDEASGILYAAYYNGGVRALDIRGDLSTCTSAQKNISGKCDLGLMGRLLGKALDGSGFFVWGVQGSGNRLYASDMNSGLQVLDITPLKR